MHRPSNRSGVLLATFLSVITTTSACSFSPLTENTTLIGFTATGESRREACYDPARECNRSVADLKRPAANESVVIID